MTISVKNHHGRLTLIAGDDYLLLDIHLLVMSILMRKCRLIYPQINQPTWQHWTLGAPGCSIPIGPKLWKWYQPGRELTATWVALVILGCLAYSWRPQQFWNLRLDLWFELWLCDSLPLLLCSLCYHDWLYPHLMFVCSNFRNFFGKKSTTPSWCLFGFAIVLPQGVHIANMRAHIYVRLSFTHTYPNIYIYI